MMRITVLQLAEALGVDPLTVREMLKSGNCPLGMAYKPDGHSRWTYVIYPKAYEELIGKESKQ